MKSREIITHHPFYHLNKNATDAKLILENQPENTCFFTDGEKK